MSHQRFAIIITSFIGSSAVSTTSPFVPQSTSALPTSPTPTLRPPVYPSVSAHSTSEPPTPSIKEYTSYTLIGISGRINYWNTVYRAQEWEIRSIQCLFHLYVQEFLLKLELEGHSWRHVSQGTKDYFWEEFKKHFTWDPSLEVAIKRRWQQQPSTWYADNLSRWRKSVLFCQAKKLGPEADYLELFE